MDGFIDVSSELFEQILRRIGSDEQSQIEGLDEICLLFIQSYSESIECAPFVQIMRVASDILSKTTNPMVIQLCCSCFQFILQGSPVAALLLRVTGVFPNLLQKLQQEDSELYFESVIDLLSVTVEENEEFIADVNDLGPLLRNFEFRVPRIQVIISKLCRIVITKSSNVNYPASLKLISSVLPIATSNAQMILQNSVLEILSRINDIRAITEAIKSTLLMLQNIIDPVSIVKSLINILTKDEICDAICQSSELIVLCRNSMQNDSLRDCLIELICHLLPFDPKAFPYFPFRRRGTRIAKSFSQVISQYIIDGFLIAKQPSCFYIYGLALVNSVNSLPFSDDLKECLLAASLDHNLCCAVVALVAGTKIPEFAFINTDIIINQSQRNWASKIINSIRQKNDPSRIRKYLEPTDPSQIIESICNIPINLIQEWSNTESFTNSIQYIKQHKHFEEKQIKDLELLLQRIMTVLAVQLNKETPHFEKPSPEDLKEQTVELLLNYENRTQTFRIGVLDYFMTLEGFLNQSVSSDAIQAAARASGLDKAIEVRRTGENEVYAKGLECRLFHPKNAKRLTFFANGKPYHIYSSVIQLIASNYRSIQEAYGSSISIDVEDMEIDTPIFQFQKKLSESSQKLAGFANRLQKLLPQAVYSKQMNSYVELQMENPLYVYSNISPAASLIYYYPSLFPLEIRSKFLDIAAFDQHMALSSTMKLTGQTINLQINRDSIVEQGIQFLELITGPIRPTVNFLGEEAIGTGPTHEFFRLLSNEFLKTSRNMWYNEHSGKEYASHKSGLFPHPNANPHDFYLYGCLFGKSSYSGCKIHAPLSPAFFSMVQGKQLQLKDVDPEMAELFESKENLFGLEYAFPLDSVAMPNPNNHSFIDQENVDEYINTYTEIRVGARIEALVQEFVNGFVSVVSLSPFLVLSPIEMLTYFNGMGVTVFDRDELLSVLHFQNGYYPTHPAVQMFIDILVSYTPDECSGFLEFITGSPVTPVGGLAAISPPITIALKEAEGKNGSDGILPTVLTCSHYLKLPPYSTPDVMRHRLKCAVEFGLKFFGYS